MASARWGAGGTDRIHHAFSSVRSKSRRNVDGIIASIFSLRVSPLRRRRLHWWRRASADIHSRRLQCAIRLLDGGGNKDVSARCQLALVAGHVKYNWSIGGDDNPLLAVFVLEHHDLTFT